MTRAIWERLQARKAAKLGEYDFAPEKPYWHCEECGHKDRTKPMPKDRNSFFAREAQHGGLHCPKCLSPGSWRPKGY